MSAEKNRENIVEFKAPDSETLKLAVEGLESVAVNIPVRSTNAGRSLDTEVAAAIPEYHPNGI